MHDNYNGLEHDITYLAHQVENLDIRTGKV
jgi:hypothetical protein